jgi:hypothetical protein
MIWQIDFPSAWSAVLRLDKGWADFTVLMCSALAGALLLIALIGSSALPTEPVGICLILALLSALAGIDRALKRFPMQKVALAPGVVLTLLAMVMLFHH